MNARLLVSAALRFFALYTLVQAVESAGEVVFFSGLFQGATGDGSTGRSVVGGMVFTLVFELAVAGFLLARTDVVTRWVLRGQGSGEETVSFTARELAAITFYVAGVIFLVAGLDRLLGQTANWYLHRQGVIAGMRRIEVPAMVTAGVKTIAGIILLLAARRQTRGRHLGCLTEVKGMNIVMRIVVTLISGVATLYFVFWVGGALAFSLHLPFWIVSLGSLLVAAVVAWYVWTHSASFQASLASSVLLGAFVVGGIGFSAGFFGPLLFPPGASANVGPVLGIFITGPLGFILGAVGGAVHWYARGRQAGRTSV